MTAPGGGPAGKIVGRVTIRVAPDTSGFRAQLRRELQAVANESIEIKVTFDVDTAGLRAQLAALDETIRVRVIVDDPEQNNVNLDARLNIDRAHFRAQVAAINPVRLDARINVDSARIAAEVRRAINAGIASANDVDVDSERGVGGGGGGGSGNNGRSRGIFGFIQRGLTAPVGIISGLFTAMKGLATLNFDTFREGLTSAASSAAALAGLIGLAGAASGLLVTAGAAITAAWGLVSTAIAVVPAALFAVAIPLGTVLLGMEGIKKAAQTLAPEMDRLQAAVSRVFERDFTQVFNTVRPLFAEFTDDFVRVAEGIGNLAQSLADFFSGQELVKQNLSFVFQNVAQFIEDLAFPLELIGATMIQVASDARGLNSILALLVGFARSFNDEVNELTKTGELGKAFDGLILVLYSLGEAFANLVSNGIQLFANAAPGIAGFLQGLTQFFDRFDWATLGTAVGNVFKGMGEALAKVDQGTINAIVDGFKAIGDTFASPNYQQMFANILEAIPLVLQALGFLIQGFLRVGSAVIGFIQILKGVALGAAAFTQLVTGQISFAEFENVFKVGKSLVDRGWQNIKDAFATGGAEVATEASRAQEKIGAELAKGGALTGAALGAVVAQVETSLKPGDKDYAPEWKAKVDKIAPSVGQSLGVLKGTVEAGVSGSTKALEPTVDQSLKELWNGLFKSISEGIVTGGASTTLTATETTGKLGSALGPLGEGAAAPAKWGAVMGGVQSAIDAGGVGWSASALTASTSTATATTQGLSGVAPAATDALAPVGPAIAGAFTAIAIDVQLAAIQTRVSVAMGILVAVVKLGMANVSLALASGWVMSSASTTAAMAVIVSAVNIGMAAIVLRVTAGMVAVRTSVIAGLVGVTAAFVTNIAIWVSTLQAGIQRAVSALAAGVPQFQAAGRAMGQGLVNGLNSQLGPVQAAARRLADAAAAAVRAAAVIRSPSKVTTRLGAYFGEGFANGITNAIALVRRASARLTNVATSSLADIKSVLGPENDFTSSINTSSASTVSGDLNAVVSDGSFGNIGDRVAEALEGWTVEIDSRGVAKMVNKTNTSNRRR